ncbi:MAG TPA: hypothetical protein DD490_26155 [Acidobacteria bacterium]|nr:hypothetical protein [Acidobacteriota bacterium]
MSDKRLRYYNGQFLQQQDFTAEQDYQLDRHRRHNRQLHTYGIAEGLTVTAGVGATSAVVSPGTAIDGEGRTIVLTESRNVPFNGLTGSVLVVISYNQQTSDPATVGDEGDTRWWERPDVAVIAEAGAPAADVRLRLARLQIAGNNTVTTHDTTVRTSAGVRLGTEVAIERIRLSRQGVAQPQWPVLSSGAAGQADLTGNLAVAGNIAVTGTVDGRDVSVDGARIDSLSASTIQGVSNIGGNINLVGQNGLTIVGNDAANTITFGTGSPTSIDGVSNPGGNIDFVGQGGISITPDNTGKLIAFNTSPAAIGAVPIGDYQLRNQFTGNWSLFTNDADGAVRTVDLGFQPRLVWVHGFSNCYFQASGGWSFGGVTNGSARLIGAPSNIAQHCTGTEIYRTNAIPYVIPYSAGSATEVARAYFYEYTGTVYNVVSLSIRISSFTATSLTFTFNKSGTPPGSFSFYIYFHIFGS